MLNLFCVVLNSVLAGMLIGNRQYGFLLGLNIIAVVINMVVVSAKIIG
jgi:tetrahydromethanopterin S-methyltransferase subunit B